MSNLSNRLARLEKLEAKRSDDKGIVFVGRIDRNKDGSLIVYSDVSRNCLDGNDTPERIIERVPKHRAAQWLKELIRIQPAQNYGK